MNLLIIGNGFDLAHSLPTSYIDFLKYCRGYSKDKQISESDKMNQEFLSSISDNMWMKYFLKSTNFNDSRTWIDFEKEIAAIIDYFNKSNAEIKRVNYLSGPNDMVLEFLQGSPPRKLEHFILSFCDRGMDEYIVTNRYTNDIKNITHFMYSHLRIFARAFEIYCININTISIKEITTSNDLKNRFLMHKIK